MRCSSACALDIADRRLVELDAQAADLVLLVVAATMATVDPLVVFGLWQLFQGVAYGRSGSVTGLVTTIVIFVLLFIAGLLFLSGLYTLQPNEAALLPGAEEAHGALGEGSMQRLRQAKNRSTSALESRSPLTTLAMPLTTIQCSLR